MQNFDPTHANFRSSRHIGKALAAPYQEARMTRKS